MGMLRNKFSHISLKERSRFYLSSSSVSRLNGSHPCAEVEISGCQLREWDMMFLSSELVNPTFRKRDSHCHVLAWNLTPGFGVRIRDHHVSANDNLEMERNHLTGSRITESTANSYQIFPAPMLLKMKTAITLKWSTKRWPLCN